MPERSTKKRNATEMEEEGQRCAVGYSLLHCNIYSGKTTYCKWILNLTFFLTSFRNEVQSMLEKFGCKWIFVLLF